MPSMSTDETVENACHFDPKNEQLASNSTKPKPPTHRLGILSLGWHAHEPAMPAALLAKLQANDAMIISNMIPLLGRLSGQDPSIESTYLCDPSVQYFTKLPREGSFCGYRNIQMLISCLLGRGSESESKSEAQIAEFPFLNGTPSILSLQDLIEAAWDRGFNSSARIETGGIRGTRKHIGTPEAQALFQSLGIPCQVRRFQSDGDSNAFNALLIYVEAHFTKDSNLSSPAATPAPKTELHRTLHPPIYLQRPRHSLTIVGLEVHKSGKRTLLVLDPGYRPSPRMVRAAAAAGNGKTIEKRVSLHPYRKGRWALGGYREFEVLTLRE